MKNILRLTMLFFALAALLVGCTLDGPTGSEESATTEEESTNESTTDQITIGATTVTLRHQFFIEMDEGMKEAALEKNVNLIVNDPNVDAQKQIAAIEDFIQQGVKGLVVVGTDPSAIVPAVDEAAAKMPIVTIDMQLNTDSVDSFVGTLNDEAGKKLGEHTRAYIEKELGGVAKIAVVTWLESSIQRQRIEGFLSAFEGMDGVTILNPQPGYDREESMNTVENILQADKDINIIYATAENSVLGSMAATESANRKDVKIVGFDLTKEAADGIVDGKILSMIQQQPREMGRQAIYAILDKINGKEIDSNIPIPVLLYDKDNVADFLNQ